MSNEKNMLVLAYLGDGVYELYIRSYLVQKGYAKIGELQKAAIPFVSAKGQAKHLKRLSEMSFFTEEEENIIARARNHKGHGSPKNTDIVTYKQATGLEALVGFLYLEKRTERLEAMMKEIIGD